MIIGDIVQIKGRNNLFVICGTKSNDYIVARVKKDYSIAGTRSFYLVGESNLTVVIHRFSYEDLTMEKVYAIKHEIIERAKENKRNPIYAGQKISAEIWNKFYNLANRLSPENLSCDGECSRSEVKKRLRIINMEWKALEERIGHIMPVDVVEKRSTDEYMTS